MNLPEGFVLDVEEPTGFSELPEGFIPEKELNKDVNSLKQMKASGQQLTRDQERVLWDADEAKPLTQKASEAITTFFPTAVDIAGQLGSGAAEFVYKGILKPLDTMSQSSEEAEKTLKEAKNTWRSAVHGVAQDIQETADAGVRFAMFGSSITDKLLGKSDDERFEKYMLREGMREFSQRVYEDNPDAAARLLSENPLLQNLAYAAALAQGGTEEEAQMAKKAYEQLVKESGLSKDEINENVALFGEVISPLSLPGTNTATKFLNKGTSKVVQKTGELALRGIKPLAKGVEKTAGGLEKLVEGTEKLSRKIGEYTVGDPDTLLKSSTTTVLAPVKIPAKMTRGIARTIADVAGEAGGVGGAAGRRGLFERAGRSATAGDLTKRLFGPESLGGKGRARAADWAVRQANAIAQPAVNGAVLNIAMGLPDIETGEDLGYMAGVGAGIGGYGGARLPERAYALVDPRTSLAQKIDAVATPDPAGLRRDQDADIQRFVATADPTLLDSIDNLSNLDNIKGSIDLKIKNLEGKRDAQIRDEDAKRIQTQIDNLQNQRKQLDKSTPQTEAEIKRQIQLSFADAMDLAKTTGAAAGLNNIQVKVLTPDKVEQFYRDLYGKTLTDAESVVQQLVGNPRLTEQESAMLKMADETIKQFFRDVAGATTARGFAISESSARPEHLRYANQKGATVVINGDLVAQMGRDGLNLGRVINHEMQHALSNFQEVQDMLAPLRRQLFDQKVQNPDGTFEVVSNGAISDAQLDQYALQYAAAMDANGGQSFLSQFANMDQVRAYMKEEVLSELAGLSGVSHGDLRSSLDSTGRQVVDWLEVKSQNGALKKIKEGLRRFGVLVDDQGQFSSVLGAQLTPEALAAMRQYQRKLRDLNESMVYNSDPRKDAPEITFTQIATNRVLQERYKHSDFFAQEQVVTLTTPDGKTQEIVVPPGAKVDSFVSDYRFQNGQLVDEDGNPVSLGPDIPLQAMPDGTAVTIDTRVARNADGSPQILSPRETKRRAKKRGEAIRKAIDDAPDDGSGLRLEDTGNGNYRGTLSPTQISAINALPNDLVAPSLKRKIAFFNDILGRKDGSIVEIEYQAALRDKKYRALQPQLRTEIPIGFQFDKQGNFLMTTMSMSRMHDKANSWAAKRPRNLRLWGGDMTKFWDSVRQYLTNHKAGLQGHIGLHPDPYISMRMKNRINDLFNVYRKETREANPERTTLPKVRGQDSRDVVIRSRRMDRINSYDEAALPKMPFQYELAVQNYLPAENPFAEYQSAEQFAQGMEVEPELVQRAIRGDIEPLELQLHEQDLLRPAEFVDVRDGQIRVRSMFDPTQNVFVPGESEPEVPAMLGTQFMPAEAIEAPSGERGFKSKLQTEIQNKFKGANATPEQLKAVVGNPQFVKPEEVKWSGVMDEIDRLAQENKGKVPVQELLNYLRDEGQVKFEEVTLGGVSKLRTQDEIDQLERQARRTGRWEEYELAVLEFEDQQLGSDANQTGNQTKYAQYQLPGGENYREVVLSMPIKTELPNEFSVVEKPNNPEKSRWIVLGPGPLPENRYSSGETRESAIQNFNRVHNESSFTSSHFPDVPNYIAHMRLNDRTIQGTGYAVRNTQSGRKGPVKATREEAEADLKQYPASYSLEIVEVPRDEEGLFVEEFQSDRHQRGREKGYKEDYKPLSKEEKERKSVLLERMSILEENGIHEENPNAEFEELNSEYLNLAFRDQGGRISSVPDAPFRKDWGVQLFKRALRDAVESGKKWIGWTTGETQAERYDLSKRLSKIEWVEDLNILTAYDPSGNKVIEEKATKEQLPDIIGKEATQKLIDSKPYAEGQRILSGLDLKVGGEGMKGFYDQILPKEIGKYVAKMGGKVEKSEIGQEITKDDLGMEGLEDATPEELAEFEATGKVVGETVPIWRVNITPEMENVVRAGQIQFMPADSENIMFANPPSEQEAIDALSSNKRNFFGLHRNLEDGYPVGLRIDIPAFTSRGVYVVTVHEKKKGKEKGQVGDRIGYDTIAKVTDPVFFSNEIGAKKIKSGEANKFPVATVEGKFNSSRDIPEDINEWTPVGYNPKDHSYFYDKRNEEPVLSGDEAISVGNTVFVKNPVYGNRSDFAFMPAEQEPQGMEGVEAPQTYRRISGMIPPLQGVEPPVRASGKQDKPLVGININDKTQDFTDQILRGEKTIETRDTNSLKSYIGKRVGIVKTGKGKATLVGYANIGEPIVYNNENEFRLDEDKHLVEQGSPFDIKPNSSKYGYPLTNVESIEPIQIPSDLPNWRVARSLPQTQFMPIEQLGGGELPEAIAKGTGEFGILRQALQGVEAPIREPAKTPEIPKQQVEVKQEIPVAKTEADAEEEVADTELRSTGIEVPESVDEQSVISNAIKVANSQSWKKGRDFKMDMQRRVMEAAEKAGVTISERTAESIEYLARVGLKDALIALEQNPNAIGWYDEKTKQALGVMSLLFPEIASDENARFAFTWALAVTSNGLKVDKNFELAERVYRQYRKTGKMPTNIEAGQAQKAINEGLDLFNKLTKEWGMENTRKFMQTDFTVGEISRLSKDLSPGGEFSDTNVRGSAILGPKIGNGFFSNLYGLFDALTMDRWLVRTWGRWTGTLVELNPELTKQATDRLQEAVQKLTPEDKARMDKMIKQDISQMSLEDLSVAIQKASMKPELRQLMNQTETGEEFRKSGNGLAKYLDGQKEAPSGPAERNFIREIFGLMLDELKSDPKYAGLTMADLQAVLWYAEKRLYETAKVKADQDNLDSSDADGYEDDEAPDYANAAIGVAREKGVSQKRIDEVLERIKNDRTTITRPEAEEGSADQARKQEGAGGFTGKEKQEFRQYVAATTARRNRTGNEKALWTYARRSGGDGSNAGVLKPKSKKNLGVKYISEWKPGRKLATMFRNNGLPSVKFLELDSTDKASAQKFADALRQSKDQSKFGAAVYVYSTEKYQDMKLFLSESGQSGFALKPDGDIVSVFSMDKGSGRSIMEVAIAAGGKKLDAFDTILPEFYGTHGFVEAARIPWNDKIAKETMPDWNKETFKKYNNGEPDIVMMVLDPKFEGEYEPRTDIYATDYEQALEMQDSLLKKLNKGVKKK